MKQYLIYTHDLKLKTVAITDVTPRHFDCVSPQKTTIELPLNYAIENDDLVVIRDQDTAEVEYVGMIDTVAHDKTTTVLLYPFEGIFDNECVLENINGDLFVWIKNAIQRNFVNTGDALNDFPIIVENNTARYAHFLTPQELAAISYKHIVESKNLLDNLNEIFLNRGVYIKAGMKYDGEGQAQSIIIGVYDANDDEPLNIRFDNPQIVDGKVLIERSNAGNPNKAIVQIKDENDEVVHTANIYLREDNRLTTDPTDAERIKQVKTTIIDYKPSEDEITAEQQGDAIILLAEKALCGNAFDHSIEFTVVLNEGYDWRVNKRCDFTAEDRIYNTYITSVEYLSDRHAKIRLGAYRYTLTDRFKKFRQKAEDVGLNGIMVSSGVGSNVFYFTQEGGDLYLNYPEGMTQPPFSIDGDGNLVIDSVYASKYALDGEGDLLYNE